MDGISRWPIEKLRAHAGASQTPLAALDKALTDLEQQAFDHATAKERHPQLQDRVYRDFIRGKLSEMYSVLVPNTDMDSEINRLFDSVRRQVRETTGLDNTLLTLRMTQPPSSAHEEVRKWVKEVEVSLIQRLQALGLLPTPPSDLSQ